jgi:uncharacterized protein (UPF0305 family)
MALFSEQNTSEHHNLFKKINRLDAIYTQYSEDESYFLQIETIAGTACEYIEDKEAHTYVMAVARALIDFSKDVFSISIGNITDYQIDAKITNAIITLKGIFSTYWGAEETEEYYREMAEARGEYINKIKMISDDFVNSKNQRFRAETIVFMHVVMRNFVIWYNNNILPARIEQDEDKSS